MTQAVHTNRIDGVAVAPAAFYNRLRMAVGPALVSCLMALAVLPGIAHADQTDPRLDELFDELRTGRAVNVDANVGRIQEIWADAASDTTDLLYLRALDRYNEGDYDTALQLLVYIHSLSPNFMQGYALSGYVRLSIGDQAAALSDFSRVLELEPRHFEVRSTLANLLMAAGETRDAFEMVQSALEWNPHDPDLQRLATQLREDITGQDI